jgi:hypothetical protein
MPSQPSSQRQCSHCGSIDTMAFRASSCGFDTTVIDYRCRQCGHVDQAVRHDQAMWTLARPRPDSEARQTR